AWCRRDDGPSNRLPVPFPAIPGVERISKPIVHETCGLPDHRQSKRPPEPGIARGPEPNCDRAIGADMKLAVGVNAIQPTTDLLHPGAEAGQRIGLKINVTEFDGTGSGRTDQPAALPLDSGVTDRTFGVVPDCEFRAHSPPGCDRVSVPLG